MLWLHQEHGKYNGLYSVDTEMLKKFYFSWTLHVPIGQWRVTLSCLKTSGVVWINLLIEAQKQYNWCCWSTLCRLADCLLLPSFRQHSLTLAEIGRDFLLCPALHHMLSPVFLWHFWLSISVRIYQILYSETLKNNAKEEHVPRGVEKQAYSYLV